MEPIVQQARSSAVQELQFRIDRCAFDALSEHYVLNPIPQSEHAQARSLLLMRRTCRAIESNRR